MVKRVLFIGIGSIGRRHLKNLRNILPSIEIAALRSNNKKIHGESELIDHQFYSLENAKKFDPELVFITNPTSLHIETALEFMDIASGIFIEKPLSDNIQNAEKLVKKSKNLCIHVACPLRFHPVIKFLKNYFKHPNEINNIRIISGSYLPSWRPEKDYKLFYSVNKKLGGGVSLDLIHDIDLMRWIFGDISKGYFGSTKISDLEMDVEDTAYGIWKLESGALCEIHLDYYRKIPKRDLEIITGNSVIHADLVNSTIKIFEENKENVYNFDFDRNDMYIEEMNYFLDCVDNGKKSFNSTSYAFETLKYAIYMRDNMGIVKI